MNLDKLREFYRESNSNLTETFNLGADNKKYLKEVYEFEPNVMNALYLFKVYPPVTYKGSPVEGDEFASLMLETLEEECGVKVTETYEEYETELYARLNEHRDNVIYKGGAETPYLKSMLNMYRNMYYNNVEYNAVIEGLPESEEVNFLLNVEELKQDKFIDIYSDDKFTVQDYVEAKAELIKEVEDTVHILSAKSLVTGASGDERAALAQEKLEENWEMDIYLRENKGVSKYWREFEDYRVINMCEKATDAVIAKMAEPNL